MTNWPVFVDNLDGNTLAEALSSVLERGTGDGAEGGGLEAVRIATAFFSPTGFGHIADRLASVPDVRLLLGVDLAQGPAGERRRLGESEAAFQGRRMQRGLRRLTADFAGERDHLPFNRTTFALLRKLKAALSAGNVEVRRFEKAFLHAKAYIVTSADGSANEGIIAGSSNLTGAGLNHNLELNLGRDDEAVVRRSRQWFDDLWEEAEPYDLASVFEVTAYPHTPWEIFIRVLWQLYGAEVEDDAQIDENLPLTSFQKHGVARALRLIRDLGGVIVADEVGLGKTFIAGEILQLYGRGRQRALLICPAALRDTTWAKFLAAYQLFVECLSFEQLANDQQLQDPQQLREGHEHLRRPLEEYQLVIVDEAHNYRNPATPTRAAVLRRLLFGQPRDVLFLTATPVNNSLWDLYHLIRFFMRQDARLADKGILSIRERFEQAMRQDPTDLNPDLLYPIIDATTVKRTRQFVKKHYARDTIAGPDGVPVPIIFPQPVAITVRYELDGVLPGFFDTLEAALDPDGADSLSFARYTPEAFMKDASDAEESARAMALIGLLRSGLLKRFESSAFAFRETVVRMASHHDTFLDALDLGHVVTTAFLNELSGDEEGVFEVALDESEHTAPACAYDVDRLRAAVERDRDRLRELANAVAAITYDKDPKLAALGDALAVIASRAEEEAVGSIDEQQKRKVLIFSAFEDTVRWIRDYLSLAVEASPELYAYRGRVATVSGSDELGEVSRRRAVQGFAPVSMEAPTGADEDLYDILIATDVLAEGVNLQQCRNIINFDMPWNPMRLVQRHGRIDRIGSAHDRVFLRTVFPVDRLDEMLGLEERILEKLAMAAASVGVAAPIEGAAQGGQVFTETRAEIERLLAEDPSLFERGGTVGAAQTGEEYRQTLRKALEHEGRRIANLPWKIGSGMVHGTRRGMFFCSVVGHGTDLERTYLRFVPATDDWVPDPVEVERELGACLRIIECSEDTSTWYPDHVTERVFDFWEVAQEDILIDWMRETDPANLQPKVRPLNHRVAEFVRENPHPGESHDRVTRALDILESPWPRREEVLLRGWFEGAESGHGASVSADLVEKVLGTGLEPAVPPKLLPPIERDDIEVLCWLVCEK
ncbi:MAG: helicase-related protein [Gammaproteobacteria bacterium]|nr:helicase-related protein [Gammaproteobacteria bacterium]